MKNDSTPVITFQVDDNPYVKQISLHPVTTSQRFEVPYQLRIEFASPDSRERFGKKIESRRSHFGDIFPKDPVTENNALIYPVDSNTGYQALNLLRSHEFGVPTHTFLALSDILKTPVMEWQTKDQAADVQEIRVFKAYTGDFDIFVRFNSTEADRLFRYRVFEEGQTGIGKLRIRLCGEPWIPQDDDPKCCFIEGKYLQPQDSAVVGPATATDGIMQVLNLLKNEFHMPAEDTARLGMGLSRLANNGRRY